MVAPYSSTGDFSFTSLDASPGWQCTTHLQLETPENIVHGANFTPAHFHLKDVHCSSGSLFLSVPPDLLRNCARDGAPLVTLACSVRYVLFLPSDTKPEIW